jgi:uncharacterized protein (TIGR03118 family)
MKSRAFPSLFCVSLLLLTISTAAMAQYQVNNLVSNQVGRASHIDPLSVNAWGLAYGPGGPIWVSDAGSGWATIYTGTGVQKSLKVEIPTASGGGVGSATGIVFNGSQEFQVQGWASVFIFATLDGTISGWAPQSDPNNALIAVNNSNTGAVYTGLAITNHPTGNFIYAADVANGKVDMYDGTFTFKKSFTDPAVPAGFTPLGIADINGQVYVSFADSAGGPGGVIDIFKEDGTMVKTLIQGSPLNQPWGFAVAPANFGPLSNTLLITNNTNQGNIHGFNLSNGALVGTMKDVQGNVIKIDQLWGIVFGGGTANDGRTNELFFTAGPNNNLTGTFGSIVFKPTI